MSRSNTIAIIATLDTKGIEVEYLRDQIEALGGMVVLVDIGVIDPPVVEAEITRDMVAETAGTSMAALLENPTRQEASAVMIKGASILMNEMREEGRIHGVIGLGGTQGTPNCTAIMRNLPYGFPKVMVSTIASGDVSSFVDIKDITMMFSVGDILGLNPLTRRILANAAGAAWGMTRARQHLKPVHADRRVIGMTNLGVLTNGALHALRQFEDRGYEVIVFHAVGSGGRAMEQLMREGVIEGVFDYAMGEISDEVHGGLRAGGKDRLTVAGELGIPQVICPGGAEHIGLLVEPNTVPDRFSEHKHVFHNPVIFAPRLNAEELEAVAEDVGRRLAATKGNTVMMVPMRGVSRYSIEGGPLHDPEGDRRFFEALCHHCPDEVQFIEVDAAAEDPDFVDTCVEWLCARVEGHAHVS